MDSVLAAAYDHAAAAVYERVQEVVPGVIGGVRNPEGSWTAGYGVGDLVTGTSAPVDAHIRIASVPIASAKADAIHDGMRGMPHPL